MRCFEYVKKKKNSILTCYINTSYPLTNKLVIFFSKIYTLVLKYSNGTGDFVYHNVTWQHETQTITDN